MLIMKKNAIAAANTPQRMSVFFTKREVRYDESASAMLYTLLLFWRMYMRLYFLSLPTESSSPTISAAADSMTEMSRSEVSEVMYAKHLLEAE